MFYDFKYLCIIMVIMRLWNEKINEYDPRAIMYSIIANFKDTPVEIDTNLTFLGVDMEQPTEYQGTITSDARSRENMTGLLMTWGPQSQYRRTVLLKCIVELLCVGARWTHNCIKSTEPGPHSNIKTVVPRYGGSHVKDKTVVRPSHL